MAGKRSKPIHPFVKELMDSKGFQNVEEFARFLASKTKKVSIASFRHLADGKGTPETHYYASKILKIKTDEWIERFYGLPKVAI